MLNATPADEPYAMVEADDALVRFIDVQKTFDGETLVVKDLNLDVADGEFLTLLGPSGSGKTTTLMMLAGFESVTQGDILLAGQSLKSTPPHRRNIGMVFQNYALFPHMTVEENLVFPLESRGANKTEISEKVRRALEMVELRDFGKRRPKQLSGGQQQRVAVARALVYEPRLVLMDEPLGALDRQLREVMQYELKRIHKEIDVTILYVTHDQSEALTMSDRVAVFNDGEIQQLASPSDLYEQPENAFVAQFIGENNRLMGTVKEIQGDQCAVEIEGGHVLASAINIDGIGARTTLSIRPESVRIDPPEDGYPDRFEARIEELIYLGDHLRVRVRTCGHDDFIIKVPRSRETPVVEVGQTRTIGWHPSDCRALDVPD